MLGIRAGRGPHRVIGIWAVVVDRRVFARSWGREADGWYATLVREPRGIVAIGGRTIPVRTVRTRGERLKDAISRAYREKYSTAGSLRYVRDLSRPKCRNASIEFVPTG